MEIENRIRKICCSNKNVNYWFIVKKILFTVLKQIKAMLDGSVTMAEPDLFYTGGTLIFDHGHGISTLYMHM